MSENKPADRSTWLAEKRTKLAFDRTRFAADRTLMAWIRTSISMIGFGFSIYKFFQYLRESGTLAVDWRPQGPRNLGLTLIALGTGLLIVAIVEHVQFLRRLSKEAQHGFPKFTTLITAIIISVIGLFTLVNLLFQIGPF